MTDKVFGYQLVAFTRIGTVGQTTPEPLLTDRIFVVPANASMSEPTLAALDRMASEGHPVTEIAVDRGFSNATAEKWADQLRKRGIEQVLDLHAQDHDVTDFEGIKMIAGWAYRPAMPAELDDIRRPATLTAGKLKKSAAAAERAAHQQRVEEMDEFNERIAKREEYEFVRHSRGQNRSKTGKKGWSRSPFRTLSARSCVNATHGAAQNGRPRSSDAPAWKRHLGC